MIAGGRDSDRRAAEAEVTQELQFHIEEQVETLMLDGWTEPAAREEVGRRFGNFDAVHSASVREVRARFMAERRRVARERWWLDIKGALRGLARHRRFALGVIATLALGIGTATGVFSIVTGILLRPLEYPEPDRLVRVFEQNSPTNRFGLSVADYLGIAERQRSFSDFGAYSVTELALTGFDRPEWVRAGRATSSFFSVLGVQPARGRGITDADETQGAEPVAVVTAAGAARWFGSEDPLGRTLTLNGVQVPIVGVLSPTVRDLAGLDADVWFPLTMAEPTRRGPFFLRGVGRLADGVTLERAREDLARVSREIFPIWEAGFRDETALLTPYDLKEVLVGDVGPMLLLLQAAVLALFLIGCANVTNLVIVRTSLRTRELSVRAALGAGRERISRMLLAEGLVLAAVGGIVGLALARIGVAAFVAFGPDLPRLEGVGLSGQAVAAGAILALACGVLIGLVPGAVGRFDGGGTARLGRSSSAGKATRALRGTLVVAEFALAVPLLVAAALFLRSLQSLQQVDIGFNTERVASITISLPDATYPDPSAVSEFWTETLRRVRAVPSVTGAGLSSSLPPDAPTWSNNFDLLDRPVTPGDAQPVSPWGAADPGLFKALGIQIVDGRGFEDSDGALDVPVLLVSRSWAERYFPGERAVGRRMFEGGGSTPNEIIGVVGDVKYQGLDGGADAVYWSLDQAPRNSLHLVFRSRVPVEEAMESVRAAIRSVDPLLPLTDAGSIEERLHDAVASPRHWSLLIAAFSVAAALLAAVGIFGVLSYVVGSRTREIGVRLALGAGAPGVVGMVVREGMTLAFLGAGIGLMVWLLGSRRLEGMLFGVGPRDPWVLASVTAMLLVVAVIACWVPARRAGKIDPLEAMTPD